MFQLHLSGLPDHKNICAELQDTVHARQLLKHYGPGDPIEELSDKLPNDQHHGHVQAYNALVKNSGAVGKSSKYVNGDQGT